MGLQIEATEAKTVIDIEAGVYQAIVESVEPADGTFGEQVKFTFGVAGQTTTDGNPLQLWGWASQKLNPKSKLWKWARVLTGQEPVKGTVFDVEELVGKQCSLLVIREETDDGVRCKVKDVMAPRKQIPESNIETCAQDGCNQEVSRFDAQGSPWCEAHGPKAAT